jgi:hypothetical protein
MGITNGNAFLERTCSDTVASFPPYAGLCCGLMHALGVVTDFLAGLMVGS